MATIQVRDVPDDVAELIAAKARAEHRSVSSYLRDLMATDVRRELQQRAMRQWDAELREAQARLGLPNASTTPGAEVVREIRDEYDEPQE